MAEVEKTRELGEVLKPFYQRASEAEKKYCNKGIKEGKGCAKDLSKLQELGIKRAEERLSKLEALLADKNDSGRQEMSSIIKDFQSKLEISQKELMSEREKASKEIEKLRVENVKLRYRITHLVRALKEADSKLEDKL